MAYDHRLIALTAHKMLLAAPRLTLAKIASAIGVERHTAANAIDLTCRVFFGPAEA